MHIRFHLVFFYCKLNFNIYLNVEVNFRLWYIYEVADDKGPWNVMDSKPIQ